MRGVVVIDTNLLVLLIVGTASRSHISRHERLSDYTAEDTDAVILHFCAMELNGLLPTLLRVNDAGGHGGGSRDQAEQEEADFHAFLLWQAGAAGFQP